VRLPIDAGRGISNVVARSTDGLTFETVAEVTEDQFGGVGAPAGELGCRGRDDHGARDQHRRRAVDMAGTALTGRPGEWDVRRARLAHRADLKRYRR